MTLTLDRGEISRSRRGFLRDGAADADGRRFRILLLRLENRDPVGNRSLARLNRSGHFLIDFFRRSVTIHLLL
jgi:hypothetical protein